LTATFLHGGGVHIISNMVFFFIFGDNVEDRMGHLWYIIFYFFSGVLANGAQAFMSKASTIPPIRASRALARGLCAHFFFFPHARVLTLVPLGFFTRFIEIPAFIFLGFWFVMQTLSSGAAYTAQLASRESQTGGVAFLAHVAGFITGLILGPFFGDKRSRFK